MDGAKALPKAGSRDIGLLARCSWQETLRDSGTRVASALELGNEQPSADTSSLARPVASGRTVSAEAVLGSRNGPEPLPAPLTQDGSSDENMASASEREQDEGTGTTAIPRWLAVSLIVGSTALQSVAILKFLWLQNMANYDGSDKIPDGPWSWRIPTTIVSCGVDMVSSWMFFLGHSEAVRRLTIVPESIRPLVAGLAYGPFFSVAANFLSTWRQVMQTQAVMQTFAAMLFAGRNTFNGWGALSLRVTSEMLTLHAVRPRLLKAIKKLPVLGQLNREDMGGDSSALQGNNPNSTRGIRRELLGALPMMLATSLSAVAANVPGAYFEGLRAGSAASNGTKPLLALMGDAARSWWGSYRNAAQAGAVIGLVGGLADTLDKSLRKPLARFRPPQSHEVA